MESPNNPYAPPVAAVPFALPAIPGQLDLATRWSRYLAALVDGLVWGAAAIPGVVVLFVTGGMTSGPEGAGGMSMALSMVAIGVCFIGLAVINVRMLAQNAQTIGKAALGLRIVTLDGRQADLRTILLKRVLPIVGISMIPLVGSLVNLVDTAMIFRADRRCLHDLIAGTVVVRA
jgi:uncharacterized RDD family membrane protein YckC